jgi:Na+/phosphate symporter
MGLKESVETSSVHLDVISNFRRIISFIADSGSSILQIE